MTFGGGLQSKGMAGETELREIYWGCLREREEISPPANSQEGERGEAKKRREERRKEKERKEEKLSVFSEIETHYKTLEQTRVDKRKRMVSRGELKCLLVTVGQWSFVAQLETLTTESRGQMHRYSIGLEGSMGRQSIS